MSRKARRRAQRQQGGAPPRLGGGAAGRKVGPGRAGAGQAEAGPAALSASPVAGALMGHATGAPGAAMPNLSDPQSMLRVAVGHLSSGRLADAERHIDSVLARHPEQPAALQLKGVVAHEAGRSDEAIAFLDRAVAAAPDYPEARHNRGLVHAARGAVAEAEADFARACALRPDYAEAWLNLGTARAALGRNAEALEVLDRAVAIRADYAEALLNAGNVLHTLGRDEEALARFDAVLALRPDYALAHSNRAACLAALGRGDEAREGHRRAAELAPDDAEIQAGWRDSLARLVPAWHFTMLADRGRNDAYARAIAAQVRPGDRVLDIGTGSGLLAMLAARAGAAHVFAVELNPAIAEAARAVVAANGLADRITVLTGSSLALDAGRDLGGPVDVLMAEVFDSSLLGEGALPAFRHAVSALLKPGGAVLPQAASVEAMLVELPDLRAANPLRRVMDFDLSAFDRFRNPAAARQIDLAGATHRRLTAPQAVASFDFADPPPAARWRELALPVVEAGDAHAVAFWFALTLAPGVTVSSGPGGAMTHWGQAVQFFDTGLAVQAGDRVAVTVGHTDARLYFDMLGLAPAAPAPDPTSGGETRWI